VIALFRHLFVGNSHGDPRDDEHPPNPERILVGLGGFENSIEALVWPKALGSLVGLALQERWMRTRSRSILGFPVSSQRSRHDICVVLYLAV